MTAFNGPPYKLMPSMDAWVTAAEVVVFAARSAEIRARETSSTA